MGVLAIYSPGILSSGGSTTQYVPNPWATPSSPASTVWVQCAINGLEIWDTAALIAFGIIEYESVDDHGHVHRTTFGDVGDLSDIYPDQLPSRLAIVNMLSVTLAFLAYNYSGTGEVTLFQWG
jgi:hypothetical protein